MQSALLDTGSEKWVITRKLVDEAAMEPAGCRLFVANGTTINAVCEIILNVHVGDLTIPTRFVVSDNVTEPMLGVNWLRLNRIIWDFAKDFYLSIYLSIGINVRFAAMMADVGDGLL